MHSPVICFAAYVVLGLSFALRGQAAPAKPFEFRDGDRVALVGDTLIEREGTYGYIEQRLVSQFPERNVVFRNLGWSADTPAGESRASFDFDKPGKGFEKIKEEITAIQPTVLIVGYGMADSFAGEAGLGAFRTNLNRLLDMTKEVCTNHEVRLILLSPINHEDLGRPLPKPEKHNSDLKRYAGVIEAIARERRCVYVDLSRLPGKRLTENGIHLTEHGYVVAAQAIAKGLGWENQAALDSEQAAGLREAIRKKNELYFNRWRPQNETYLFGFRKHEQGQNAKEIPMFDPLIAEQEKKIDALKKSVATGGKNLKLETLNSREPQKDQKPEKPAPEESFRSVIRLERTATSSPSSSSQETNTPQFDIAEGLEVNLYAESPLLAKPIQMNFDPRGRLWIASSAVYPQIQPGQVADDKIMVLEDTDHDGYAEKSTVFADGLFIPTGVIPGNGGCYVGQSTELLHFKDNNGDGKADQKRIVLSAFGTEDTHHIVHTLRWGPDGQLYFNQSIYIHTHIETPLGVRRLNSGGVWQFRPDTMELGVYVRGFCNPWGHEFDEFGQSFLTDGAGGKGINYGLPGATYFTYAIMRREMDSISPGNYPKFCSLEILRSEHFPKDWQGNAVTCDFRAHRVVRFGIEEKGAGYAAHEVADLLRSTNVSFRPIDVKLGPDGALYIADWSNPIIQHGEVDFRDARRDHEHGRIWRVTAKGRPLVSWPKLAEASNQQLLEQLVSVNAFNQEQARRVLAERGKRIQRDLAAWAQKQKSDEALLQALWMYQAIDVPEHHLLERVLRARDGRIQAAAVRVAGCWHNRMPGASELLAAAIKDEHPRVKLEAARALATIPSLKSAELVLSLVDKPMDSFLDYAVWLSINDLAEPWLKAIKADTWNAAGREKQLAFGLKAVEPALAGAPLAHVLAKREIARDGSGPWIDLIKTAGDAELLTRLFEQVLSGGFDEQTSVKALEAVASAARDRKVKPSGKLDRINTLLGNADPKLQEQAVRLAGSWKLEGLAPELAAVAEDRNRPQSLRAAAFASLQEIGGDQAKTKLKALAAETKDDWSKRQAILALAALDLDAASPLAVSTLMKVGTEKEAENLWHDLLKTKGAGTALAKALPKTGLPVSMAKAGLREARSGGKNEPDLVWALTRGANLEEESETLSTAELQNLAKSVMKDGDPARGEKIFRRKELSCITCHAIGGVGGKVGPDLTSIGASAQTDYLIESVLYPNRKIKEGYHTVVVETKDGKELSGVVASENTEQLVLRDSTGKELQVLKKDLQNRATAGSLMPSGLVDALTPAERMDLYRFLSELGKPGPFDAAKAKVARAWKLYPQTLDLAQFGDERILSTDLTNKVWMPAIALVDGRLLKQELRAALDEVKHRDPPAVYAAAQFEVAKAGNISLKLDGPETAQVWVDGRALSGDREFRAELASGRHRAVVKLSAKKLPQALRLESEDVTFVPE